MEEKVWTSLEATVLIGNVYKRMYVDPTLNSTAWITIHDSFIQDCVSLQIFSSLDKSPEDLKRYFEALSEPNVESNGAMFRSMYSLWKAMNLEEARTLR
eukprot:snap_masked-scaffold_11-processed-gene-4.37-mRNA-1 protein AED:1.00 eAED:1.00 QI:0/-1/0/0/-1/1/1/0/98